MHTVRKKIVTDESMQPLAVQIEYADWLEIERELGLKSKEPPMVDLSSFAGTVRWPEDGVEYQRRVRLIPSQIVRHGRRLLYRIANFNHSLRTFFDTFAAIRKLRFA